MGRPVSGALPKVRRIRRPGLARRTASSTSAVLPMPAGPRITIAAPPSRSPGGGATRLSSGSRPTRTPPSTTPRIPVITIEYPTAALPAVRRQLLCPVLSCQAGPLAGGAAARPASLVGPWLDQGRDGVPPRTHPGRHHVEHRDPHSCDGPQVTAILRGLLVPHPG